MTSQFIDKEQIKIDLLQNIEPLAEVLFGIDNVYFNVSEIRVGTKGSLVISDEGPWYSHEHGEGGGDLLSLIQYSQKCNFYEALIFASNFLDGHVVKEIIITKKKNATDTKATIAYAQTTWDNASHIDETLAERYFKSRYIYTIPQFAKRKLRFIESLKHTPSGNYYPTLIAKAQKPNGKFGGIFRIYLSRDGKQKARDGPNKMRLGSADGAAIRLSPFSENIIICEGLEDALSILYACPDKTVWCGMGASMRSVIFPEKVKHITIAADNDSAGEQYANDLANRLVKEQRTVAICKPSKGKDFNDILKG